MKVKQIITLVVFTISLQSCAKVWHRADVDYIAYEMDEKQNATHPIDSLIQPYKEQLDKKMNIVIGENTTVLTKERVESNMGNWMTDILLEEANRLTTKQVHFAIQNYGGMRIPSIGKGPIRVGTIYELMPFDNMLVVIEADGPTTKRLLDRIAEYGGWPVSHSLKFEIKNGKAENIQIMNEPFDINKSYNIALPDYIANGGDNCDFLSDLPRIEFNLLIRDVLINHIKRDTESGIHQNAVKENRIILNG